MAHKPNDTPEIATTREPKPFVTAYQRSLVRALPLATRKLAAALLTKLLEQNEGRLRIALMAQAISAREKR
jgi:hypothetical protein